MIGFFYLIDDNCCKYCCCRSRGFGFVTFAASSMLEECLAARPHIIDNKEVECKRAIPREGMQQPLPELHVTSKKVHFTCDWTVLKLIYRM